MNSPYPHRSDQCCDNCCYYSNQQCHRHAPWPRTREYIPGLPKGDFDAFWPEVAGIDWCGEWGPARD